MTAARLPSVPEPTGTGLIYSAISADPWRFDDVVQGDRWDYGRLSVDARRRRSEVELTNLVQTLSGPGGFDYDVGQLSRIWDHRRLLLRRTTRLAVPVYIYDDYLYCNDWYWRYNGCRRWPYDGGWSVGFGYGYYGYGKPAVRGILTIRTIPTTTHTDPLSPEGGDPSSPAARAITPFPAEHVGTGRLGGTSGAGREAGTVVAPPVNWRPRSTARPSGGRRLRGLTRWPRRAGCGSSGTPRQRRRAARLFGRPGSVVARIAGAEQPGRRPRAASPAPSPARNLVPRGGPSLAVSRRSARSPLVATAAMVATVVGGRSGGGGGNHGGGGGHARPRRP
jgi:hypothetical protein